MCAKKLEKQQAYRKKELTFHLIYLYKKKIIQGKYVAMRV